MSKKATETSSSNSGSSRSNLFTQATYQSSCRSKSAYANMRNSSQKRYEYTLNEDERGFLRQVLVNSGMGRGQMLALLG